MNVIYISKGGSDDNNGLTKDKAVLTIAKALSLCQNDAWNMLVFGPGIWWENFTVNVPVILVGNQTPMALSNDPGTWIIGANDADPAAKVLAPFLAVGIAFQGWGQTGKSLLVLDSVDYFKLSECRIQLSGQDQIGVDLKRGMALIYNCLFISISESPGSYYIKHTGETFPSTLYSNMFAWDSVLGYMAEDRITLDTVEGGSKARYMNNIYVDFDLVTQTLRTLHAERNAHPSTANLRDPEPGRSLCWNLTNIPVQLCTRTVEDGSRVAAAGADDHTIQDIYDKIGDITVTVGPQIYVDVRSALDRPTSESKTFPMFLSVFDGKGVPLTPDSVPTITIENVDGEVRVPETEMTYGGTTGQYYYNYVITSTSVLEVESVRIKVVVGGVTQYRNSSTEIYEEGLIPTGSEAVSILVRDRDSLVPIPDVAFSLWDETAANILGYGKTNASGQVVLFGNKAPGFSLDPGTYKVRLSKTLVSFESEYEMVVEAGGGNNFIFEGTSLTISPPALPELVRLYGNVRDLGLLFRDIDKAELTFQLAHPPAKAGDAVIFKQPLRLNSSTGTSGNNGVYFNSENGDFWIDVARGVLVRVKCQILGLQADFTSPDQPTARLIDLIPGAFA